MKILSGILILITVWLSFRHGWAILTVKPGEINMFTQWNFSKTTQVIAGILTLASGLMILFPATFFAGNLINAAVILIILAFHLKSSNLKEAMIEIPFLLLPLIMIWLGHPFKK